MSLLANIKHITALTTAIFLLTACGGGGASDNISTVGTTSVVSSTTETGTIAITNPSSKAMQSGQITDNATGKPLVNVKVSIGDESTTTDSEGYYILSNLTANKEVVVNFEKKGYLLGSIQVQLKSFAEDKKVVFNHLEYSLYAYSDAWDNGKIWTYKTENGASGGAVQVPTDITHIDIKGNIYNGRVSARWVFKDTMTIEGRNAFPGAYEGVDSNGVLVPFVSYGLTTLELEDENGTSLTVSENITLRLPGITGTTDNILSLWYYDYDEGLWIEEGYAERQIDGTYIAEISHVGTWSLNKPLEEDPGMYRGRIIDENGAPIGNVRVYAIGKNWVSSDLTTDENGIFELNVIPGEDFELSAYDYQDKFGASYNNTIAAVDSGDVVEDRG